MFSLELNLVVNNNTAYTANNTKLYKLINKKAFYF